MTHFTWLLGTCIKYLKFLIILNCFFSWIFILEYIFFLSFINFFYHKRCLIFAAIYRLMHLFTCITGTFGNLKILIFFHGAQNQVCLFLRYYVLYIEVSENLDCFMALENQCSETGLFYMNLFHYLVNLFPMCIHLLN